MTKSLARQIVRDSLRLREKERLWIHTWKHSEVLAEDIATEAVIRGASPLISITTDDLLTQILKKAPQEALMTTPEHWHQGVTKSNALVVLNGPADPATLRAADKGKALAAMGHQTRILGTAVSHQVRTLHVLTTSFTDQAAKVYGINQTSFMNLVNRSLSASQTDMINLSKQITQLLQQHRSIHISTSDGTDLQFRVRGSPPLIDDGIIDAEDIKNKSFLARLPQGTVSIPISESSAEGTVIFDTPRAFLGDIINDLRLDFKKGRLIDYRALKGEKTFTQALQTATGLKDRLSRLIFGVNPNTSDIFGQPTDALIRGTVTLGLGDNSFIGGSVRSSFSYEHTLTNAIVSIGPTAVIMDGKLTISS